MHYCTFVFTKEEPSIESLTVIMDSIGHDGWAIGGRYSGRLSTLSDSARVNKAHMYDMGEIKCYGFVVVVDDYPIHIERELVNPEYDSLRYLCEDKEFVQLMWKIHNPLFEDAFRKAVDEYAEDGWVTVVDLHN